MNIRSKLGLATQHGGTPASRVTSTNRRGGTFVRIRKLLSLPMMVGLLVGTLVGVGTVAGLAAPASAGPLPYTVYVGYGDNVHATASFPVPWYGDSGVIWEGCSGGCPNDDSGAVRVVNTGDASGLTVDSVSVNVGGCTFSSPTMSWATDLSLGFEASAIYTQTTDGSGNGCATDGTMDTSDVGPGGIAYSGICTLDAVIPTVTVEVTDSSGTTTTTFDDTGQVLNTGGFDLGTCPGGTSEATQWTPIGTAPCASGAVLTLSPSAQTLPVSTKATVTANLSACGTPLPGATVAFSVLSGPNTGVSGTGSGPTDPSGNATFSYSSSVTGTDTLQAAISTAVGSITSNTVTVTWVASFLASGAFVISDTNAALRTGVTFWGAQWAKDNVPSGGSAPNSFKGFANTTSTSPPSCGGRWTSNPGNSSGPPAGPLPQYMAIIVSSWVTQSGSVESGNILHIVVVKTNSGYQSDPGHAGTGTVVGVVC